MPPSGKRGRRLGAGALLGICFPGAIMQEEVNPGPVQDQQ
jgi:hypothetical protein